MISIVTFEPCKNDIDKNYPATEKRFPVEEFLKDPIFNGKTFWEVESEIEWIDY